MNVGEHPVLQTLRRRSGMRPSLGFGVQRKGGTFQNRRPPCIPPQQNSPCHTGLNKEAQSVESSISVEVLYKHLHPFIDSSGVQHGD